MWQFQNFGPRIEEGVLNLDLELKRISVIHSFLAGCALGHVFLWPAILCDCS